MKYFFLERYTGQSIPDEKHFAKKIIFEIFLLETLSSIQGVIQDGPI